MEENKTFNLEIDIEKFIGETKINILDILYQEPPLLSPIEDIDYLNSLPLNDAYIKNKQKREQDNKITILRDQ